MELGHLLTRSVRTHAEVSSVVFPDFYCLLLCSFRRVRKIAKSDYNLRYVCLSVRMEQLGSHWTDFHEILVLHLSIFRKSVETIEVSLKSDQNKGYFT
jgi:hypothetical protein